MKAFRSFLPPAAACLVLLQAGCASRKPPPAPPVPVSEARHAASEADKLSRQRNWTAAARQWQLAVDRFRLLNDRESEAVALHNLGYAQRQTGDLDAAEKFLREAAELNREHGHALDWWHNQIALLQVHALADDTNGLSARFEELTARLDEVQEAVLRGLFLNERGLWHKDAGRFQEAGQDFAAAEREFRAGGDAAGVATVHANQAELLEAQENLEAAIQRWQEALTEFEKLADPPGIARTLAGKGRALLAANRDLAQAEDLLRRAAQNYQTLGEKQKREETLELLLKADRSR